MKELVDLLNQATEAYDQGKPFMSDLEWDRMYWELIEKEKERKAAVKELKKVNKTIDEQNKEITQLKEQVEFLKSHKRAPSLEEIKNYTSGCKHTKAEGK